jgi:hypothetical protein
VRYLPKDSREILTSWEVAQAMGGTGTFLLVLGLLLVLVGVWVPFRGHQMRKRVEALAALGRVTSGKIVSQKEGSPTDGSAVSLRLEYVQPDGSLKEFSFPVAKGSPALFHDRKEVMVLSNADGNITYPLLESGYPLDGPYVPGRRVSTSPWAAMGGILLWAIGGTLVFLGLGAALIGVISMIQAKTPVSGSDLLVAGGIVTAIVLGIFCLDRGTAIRRPRRDPKLKGRIIKCGAHGIYYDPALHTACVVCRHAPAVT